MLFLASHIFILVISPLAIRNSIASYADSLTSNDSPAIERHYENSVRRSTSLYRSDFNDQQALSGATDTRFP